MNFDWFKFQMNIYEIKHDCLMSSHTSSTYTTLAERHDKSPKGRRQKECLKFEENVMRGSGVVLPKS